MVRELQWLSDTYFETISRLHWWHMLQVSNNSHYEVCFSSPSKVDIFQYNVCYPEVILYKDVSKSSRTVLVKRSLLTLDLHRLQNTPLLHEYNGSSFSAMLGSIPGSPFLELCQVPAAIPLESLQWCQIFDPSSEASAWGRGKSHRRPVRVSMGDGESLSCCSWPKTAKIKRPVSREIVVVENEFLVLPFLWPLAPHIFT